MLSLCVRLNSNRSGFSMEALHNCSRRDEGSEAAHCLERLYLLCSAVNLGKLELHFVCLFLELVLKLLLQ